MAGSLLPDSSFTAFSIGFAIGLGFEAGTEVGIIVTLAVLVHDFADGLNIVTVAFASGRGRGGAIVLLAVDAVASIVGIAISQVFALAPEHLGILLGVFGGAFIAIGASHLLPEAEHRKGAGGSPLIFPHDPGRFARRWYPLVDTPLAS